MIYTLWRHYTCVDKLNGIHKASWVEDLDITVSLVVMIIDTLIMPT